MSNEKNENEIPFTEPDIQDVRIIIKANDKHYHIVPNEKVANRIQCSAVRKLALRQVLRCHTIITKPLEDLNQETIDELRKN